MVDILQTPQGKILHLSRAFRFHLVTLQSLPHLPAIKGVGERTRHLRILK